jgi:hypothetical protein
MKPINKILLIENKKNQFVLFFKSLLDRKSDLYDELLYNDEYIINENKQYFDKDYYQYLSKYLCCVVNSPYNYVLPKVFEICGAGSLLLCFNYGMENVYSDLGFIDNYNYIICKRTNINEKLEWIFNPDNIDKVNEIRKRGQELMIERHRVEIRSDTVMDLLK